ncbi:hypothetical protein Tco_0834196 [Tanacetum coccineum]
MAHSLCFSLTLEMVEEFYYICVKIKRDNPKSLSRLAYYEMLLWIKVGDEDKIQQLLANTDGSDGSTFNGYDVSVNGRAPYWFPN